MSELEGKTVVITGASRGIGAAAACAFAAEGAHVFVSSRTQDALTSVVENILNTGATVTPLPCNVAQYQEVQALVEKALDLTGQLDVFIGNAGVIEPISKLEDSHPADWSTAFRINAEGIYHGLRASIPVMRQQGGGTIINISSGAAHAPLEGWSHYCASKAAAAMLTRAAHEEAGDLIRIMGLSPGTVATKMQREIAASGVNPVSRLAWEDHIPPEWPARALIWMCGPQAAAYAGQEITLRDENIRRAIGLI